MENLTTVIKLPNYWYQISLQIIICWLESWLWSKVPVDFPEAFRKPTQNIQWFCETWSVYSVWHLWCKENMQQCWKWTCFAIEGPSMWWEKKCSSVQKSLGALWAIPLRKNHFILLCSIIIVFSTIQWQNVPYRNVWACASIFKESFCLAEISDGVTQDLLAQGMSDS